MPKPPCAAGADCRARTYGKEISLNKSKKETFRVRHCSVGEDWDTFVRESANGNVFFLTPFLEGLKQDITLLQCIKGERCCAVAILPTDPDKASVVMHGFLVYGGIVFAGPLPGMSRAARISEQFAVTEFLVEQILTEYREIHLRLCPYQVDIRPYLWVNYGTSLAGFQPYVRYTSYVDIRDLSVTGNWEEAGTYQRMTKARRQEIRYARRDGNRTVETFQVDLFLELYKKTMARQSIEVSPPQLLEMQTVIENLHAAGYGRMFIAYDHQGNPGSAAFFGIDPARAYYIFGAGNPALRNTPVGSAVLWDAFRALSGDGIPEVDMVGVNSPKRGRFKLSFGGNLVPYYQLSLLRK